MIFKLLDETADLLYNISMAKKNTIQDFWNRVDKSGSCWIWQARKDIDGYGIFPFEKKERKAHRFAFEQLNGAIPKGMFVCHSCDNPSCVNPAHLFLGTLQDNHKDMMNKGRQGHGRHPGSTNPSAKLTEQQVLEIRALPGPNRKIAEVYGVAKCTIDDIRARNTWRHI